MRSEVEPVHEPPVEERTEIEIDEIVAGQTEISELKHSEELQSDDFSAENGEKKEPVARVPDYISHGLVLFGILAFFKGVLNGRDRETARTLWCVVHEVRAPVNSVAKQVCVWLGLVALATNLAGFVGGTADAALQSAGLAQLRGLVEKVVEIPIALVAEVEGGTVETTLESTELTQLRGRIEKEVVGLVAGVAVPERTAVQAPGQGADFADSVKSDGRVIGVQEEVCSLVAGVADRAVLGAVETGSEGVEARYARVTSRKISPVAL